MERKLLIARYLLHMCFVFGLKRASTIVRIKSFWSFHLKLISSYYLLACNVLPSGLKLYALPSPTPRLFTAVSNGTAILSCPLYCRDGHRYSIGTRYCALAISSARVLSIHVSSYHLYVRVWPVVLGCIGLVGKNRG